MLRGKPLAVLLVGLGLLVSVAWAGSKASKATVDCLVPMDFNVLPPEQAQAVFYVDRTKKTTAQGEISLSGCFDYKLDVKEAHNMQRLIMSIGKSNDYSLPLSTDVSVALHTVSVSPAYAVVDKNVVAGKLAVKAGIDGRSNSFLFEALSSVWQVRVGDSSRVAAFLAADLLKTIRDPTDNSLPGDGDRAAQGFLSRYIYHTARELSVPGADDMETAYEHAASTLKQNLQELNEQKYLQQIYGHLLKSNRDNIIKLKNNKYSYVNPKSNPLEKFNSEMARPSAADAFQILLRMLYLSQIGRFRSDTPETNRRKKGPAVEAIEELLEDKEESARDYNQMGQAFVDDLQYNDVVAMKGLLDSMSWMKSCGQCMGPIAAWFFGTSIDSFAGAPGVDLHSEEYQGKLAKLMQGIFHANFDGVKPPQKKARVVHTAECNSPTICYLARALALSVLKRDPNVDWMAGEMTEGVPQGTSAVLARNAIAGFDDWAKTLPDGALDTSEARAFLDDIVQGHAEARKPVRTTPIEDGALTRVRVGSVLSGHRIPHVDANAVIKMEEDVPSPEQIAMAAINAEKHEI